jgi:hypothetical protein
VDIDSLKTAKETDEVLTWSETNTVLGWSLDFGVNLPSVFVEDS